MPFQKFDVSRLNIQPLAEHASARSMSCALNSQAAAVSPKTMRTIEQIADKIRTARQRGAAVIMMVDARVVRSGCSPILIELMRRGLVTHFAMNGASAISDFELALCGSACEGAPRSASEEQQGIWRETAFFNDAIAQGAIYGLGAGESLGKYISEWMFEHKSSSVLAAGYSMNVPVTVHIGIGSDIVPEHANFDAAATGKATYDDFLVFAKSVENLEGGAFLNVGSPVAGPEVFLKCLSMARNAARQDGRRIADFTAAVFDLQPLYATDMREESMKGDPRYNFPSWLSVLSRTVADGGSGYYVQGEYRQTLAMLARALERANVA